MSHAIHKIVSIKRCQSYFISRRSPHLGISKDSELCASAHRCLHYAYARLIARVTFNLYSKGVKKKYLTPCFLYGKVSKVIDVEEKLQQAYLYDFYGELLNEHQRRIYEDFVFNDLSLGEIAGEEGITRQGVADMIKRCGKKLSDYEKKLHLVEKFLSVKKDVEEIHRLAEQFHQTKDEQIVEQIATISNQILEEL